MQNHNSPRPKGHQRSWDTISVPLGAQPVPPSSPMPPAPSPSHAAFPQRCFAGLGADTHLKALYMGLYQQTKEQGV